MRAAVSVDTAIQPALGSQDIGNVDVEHTVRSDAECVARDARLELQGQHAHVDQIRAVDALEASRQHSAHADHDFHHKIVLGSRNKWITNLLCRDLYTLLRLCRMRAGKLRQDRPCIHEEHLAIVDCIERRDADGAEQLMRAHARESRERLLRNLMS